VIPDANQPIFGLLEKRLQLLESLTTEQRACSDAAVRLDLDGMERRVARQGEICIEIRALDAEIDGLRKRWSAAEKKQVFPAAQELLAKIRLAQSEVRRLNSAHAALLRRSRYTLRAMINFANCYRLTYDLKESAGMPAASSELARA